MLHYGVRVCVLPGRETDQTERQSVRLFTELETTQKLRAHTVLTENPGLGPTIYSGSGNSK